MMKPILLATAMMISAPVVAQEAAPQQGTLSDTPSTSQDGAATGIDSVDPRADAANQADPAATANTAAAADPQPASATQIAQIVETEFPNYDGDKDGEITKDEFGKWMVALRSASDPATNAQSAEVQTWIGNAFATADADKSTKVSKVELTSFLSQGAS